MMIDVFFVWPFLFGALALCVLIAVDIARDAVKAHQATKPPNSPVIRTQAVRNTNPRNPIYGLPDISKQEEDAA